MQAVKAEPGIGLLLPCNVVVAADTSGDIAVSTVDPAQMFTMVKSDGMEPLAEEVKAMLARVLDTLKASYNK